MRGSLCENRSYVDILHGKRSNCGILHENTSNGIIVDGNMSNEVLCMETGQMVGILRRSRLNGSNSAWKQIKWGILHGNILNGGILLGKRPNGRHSARKPVK
jgi:hypothetical protein